MDPPGEARPDWRIFAEVAQKMGYEGFDWEDSNAIFEEASANSAGGRAWIKVANGETFDARAALDAIRDGGKTLHVVACTEKAARWDVINEPMHWLEGRLADQPWLSVIGPDWPLDVFRVATEAAVDEVEEQEADEEPFEISHTDPELVDPAVIESIVNHSTLKNWVEEVVGPTTLFFKEDATEKEIAAELRSLGIYVS